MTITLDNLLAGARPKYAILKASATAEGAGTSHSLWKVAGSPTAGSNPPAYTAGSGYIPTRATTGAFGQPNASSPRQLFVTSLEASFATVGKLIIYDRLWACSGLTTNAIATLSVTTPGNLTAGRLRDGSADYSDVEAWIEVYTAPGATTGTWTLTYVDGGGTGSRTATYTHPANAESVGQMMPFVMPAAAAAGVQQVTSLGFSAASGTAGDVGITLLRRIATIDGSIVNSGQFKGALDLALERVRDDACLAMMVQCSTTNTGFIQGALGLSDCDPA